MSDTVTQKFSFDVSAALASLQQFNGAMGQTGQSITALGTKLQAFNGQATSSVSALRGMASQASSTAAAFERLAKAQLGGRAPATGTRAPTASVLPNGATTNIKAGTAQAQQAFAAFGSSSSRSVQAVTVSWETLGRVVATQFVVRALSQIRNAMSDAVESSIQFQNAIAEIGTIAGKDFGGTAGIAAKVKDIATAFNVPLPTAAEAMYETLSNNIDKAAEAETFLTDASKFSKAAVTSLDNSVNLLSATVNGYGLSVSQTGNVAGKFFEAIRVGRIRADDLANTFGKVANVTKESGIGLDETLAALATYTTTGVKPAEAITALRSTANAFLKPSEAMQDALKQMGFDSGVTALQTLGLRGALEQLHDSVNGSADGMARLFPNVRSLGMAIALSGQQAEKFKTFTATIQNAGAALNDQKFAEVMASPAQKLTSELNKLKIALTTDLGAALVDDANKMLGLVGGANTLIQAGKTLGPVIETVAAALATYGAVAAATAAKNKLLETTMGRLGLVAGTVGLAVGAGHLLADSYMNNSALKQLEEANQLELAQAKATAAEKLKIAQDAEDKRVAAIVEASQRAGQAYQAAVARAKDADDAVVASAKSAGDRIISAREAIINALGRAIDQSKTIQTESASRVTGLQEKSADRKFQFDTRHLSDARKYNEYLAHSQELAKQAAKQLQAASSTGNEKGIQAAIRTFGQAQHYGEQADTIAQRLGNRRKVNDAMSNLTSLTKAQIAAEQQLSAAQDKRQTDLDTERTAQQGILETVKKNLAVVAETSSAFDENNKPLSADKLAANNAARQAALVNIIKAGSKDHDLDLTKSLGLARLATDLTKTPITLAFDSETGTAKVKQQLDDAFRNYKLEIGIDVEKLQAALGQVFRNPAEITQGIRQAQSEAATLRANASTPNSTATKTLLTELQEIDDSSRSATRNIGRFWTALGSGAGRQAMNALATFREDFVKVGTSANISDAEIAKLVAELGAVRKAASAENSGAPFGLPAFQKDILEYAQGISKIKQLQQIQQAPTGNPQRLNALDQALAGTAERLAPLRDAAGTAVNGVSQLGGAASNAAANLSRIQPTSAPIAPFPIERASGGPLDYLASGGRPRGTDRIPAMLAPGEFVVNARSSRMFATQLAAMNAGMVPNYRAQGGTVHNNTIGDVVVNVQGGNTPAHTIRSIAQGVRRELRRNTVSI